MPSGDLRDHFDLGAPQAATVTTGHHRESSRRRAFSSFQIEWVLEGSPQARATAIARSRDGAMTVIAWSCTKGRFRWQYYVDEMLHILSGEVIITDNPAASASGSRRHGVFPAGSSSIGRSPKIFAGSRLPRRGTQAGVLGLRIWNKLCRTAGKCWPRCRGDASAGGLASVERCVAAPLPPPQPARLIIQDGAGKRAWLIRSTTCPGNSAWKTRVTANEPGPYETPNSLTSWLKAGTSVECYADLACSRTARPRAAPRLAVVIGFCTEQWPCQADGSPSVPMPVANRNGMPRAARIYPQSGKPSARPDLRRELQHRCCPGLAPTRSPA